MRVWVDHAVFQLKVVQLFDTGVHRLYDLLSVERVGFVVENVLPGGSGEKTDVLLQGRGKPPKTEFLRLFERSAGRVKERRQGRNEIVQASIQAAGLMDLLAEVDVPQRALASLMRQAHHKEDVEFPAAVIEGRTHQANDALVRACELPILPPDILVSTF